MSALPNAMSVDVEDWLNATILQVTGRVLAPQCAVEANSEALLALFEEAGVKATWFFLGEVADRFPKLVQRVVGAGHEAGVHGYHHHAIGAQSRSELTENLRRAKQCVEQAGGREALGYRAVDFGLSRDTEHLLDILLELGFAYDSSLFPFSGPRYGRGDAPLEPHWVERQRGRILEVPVSVAQVGSIRLPVAGGGYFRLLPYAYTALLLDRVRAQGRPIVFYLHPAEIETASCLGPLPRDLGLRQSIVLRRMHLTQRIGRRHVAMRLTRLARAYRFETLAALYQQSVAG